MKKKSFQIALSAVSAALATVFMIMGLNVPFMFISGYVFAGIALMLPLAENFRAGGFLAYVATSLLCLPFGGIVYFYKLFPFVAFFGLHALVNAFQKNGRLTVGSPGRSKRFGSSACSARNGQCFRNFSPYPLHG